MLPWKLLRSYLSFAHVLLPQSGRETEDPGASQLTLGAGGGGAALVVPDLGPAVGPSPERSANGVTVMVRVVE